MANGYIIVGDGSTADHGLPNSFNPTPPLNPINYKNNTYVVSFSNPIDRPSIYAAVFKTNNIAPIIFAEEDIANESAVADFQAFYPASGGNLIYISFVPNTGALNVQIRTFDMNAPDKWQPVISAAGPIPQQSIHRLVHRANGDWVIVYNTFTAGQGNVFWSKWNGAVWSTPVKVSTVAMAATDSAEIVDIALDEATGNIAIYWDLTKFSEGYNIHHKYLTVLSGTTDLLGTNYNWQTNRERPGWETDGRPLYNPLQDQWEYPLITNPSDAPNLYKLLALAESGPSADPATTTIVPIIGGQDIQNVAFPRVGIDPTASKLYFLWANNYNNTFGNPAQVLFISRPLNGSSSFAVTRSTNGTGSLQWIPAGMVTSNNETTLQPDSSFAGVAYDSSGNSLTPDPTVTTAVIDLNFFTVDAGILGLVMNPLCEFQYYFRDSVLACPCPLGTVGGRAIRILSSPCDPLSTCSCD